MQLAVNGTLMRGLALNHNLTHAGATFVCASRTAPVYRLWSINDGYRGMLRVSQGGRAIEVELWDMGPTEIIGILRREPPGLTIGWILMEDGTQELGVLAESYLLEGMSDITYHGGWRAYLQSR